MNKSIMLTVRTLLVLALMLMMPLLAIPRVNAWVGSLWYEVAPAWLTIEGDISMTEFTDPPTVERDVVLIDRRRSNEDSTNSVSTSFRKNSGSLNVPESRTNSSGGSAVQLKAVYARLNELGARYIRLETVGDEQPQFRFQCQLPVGDSVYARTFERTSTDPSVAMEQVLSDVRSWQLSRRPAESTNHGGRSHR